MTDNTPGEQPPLTADIAVQAGDTVIAVDGTGRIIHWNSEAARLFGYTPAQVRGMPLGDYCSPAPGVKLDLTAIMAGRDFAGAIHGRTSAGARLTLYMFGTLGRGRDGEPAGVLLIARDVSDYWRAEQAVRSSEDKYRVLFEQSSNPVMIATLHGRILDANPAATRLIGYSPEELKTLTLADLAPPHAQPDATNATHHAATDGAASADFELRTRSQRTLQTELSLTRITIAGEPRLLAILRDVTERRRAELAITESENKYRTIFQSVNDAVLLETIDGRILQVNDNACRLLGYERGELLKLTVDDLLPLEARTWLPVVRDTLLKHRHYRAEALNLRKDGSQVPVEISASLMDLAGGNIILVLLRDITQRKQAEADLRDSEARYRTIFQTTGSATVLINEDTTVPLVNEEFTRLFGYAPDQVIGRSWTQFVHPDDLPAMKQNHQLRRIDPGAAPRNYDFRLIDKNGDVRYCALTIAMIPGATTSIASILDNTETRRAHDQLRASEDNFRALADNAADGILIADSAGRHLYANPRAAQITGYTQLQLLSATLKDLAAPDQLPLLLQRLKRRRQGRDEPPQYETAIIRASGERIPVELTASRTQWQGQPADLIVIRDITQRQQAERALRLEKKKADDYLHIAGVMIIVLDTLGRIVRINAKGADVLGLPVPHIIGADWFTTYIPERNRDQVRQAFDQLISGQLQPVEYFDNPIRTATGHERLIHWHNAILTDDDGNVTGTISSGDDVTEQRAAQAQMQASEQRYRTLIETIRDGIFTADLDGRFTHVNHAIIARSGYPIEWWLGRTLSSVVLDEYRQLITDRLAAALRGETAPPYEFAYRTASGDTVYVEHVTAPMYEDDRITGIMGVSRDITDRKQADKRLQESEDRFRRLVELAPDGIAVHQDGRVVLVNPAGARILGYDSQEEMIGKPVSDFVCERDRPLVLARIRRVLEQGRPGELAGEWFVRKDGSLVPVEVVNAPFVWRGRPAVQVMVRDITDRKRLTAKAEETVVQMSAILENSPEGIAAECEGIIAYANWRFIQLYGYEGTAQVVGRTVTDFVAPGDRERLKDYSRQRLSGEPVPANYTFLGQRRDGSFVRVETTVSTYQLQDKTYILAFLHEAPAGSRNG